MRTLETSLTLELDCEGTFIPGERSTFGPAGWYPGTRHSIERLRVFLAKGTERLEITAFLTDKEIETLEERMLEEK